MIFVLFSTLILKFGYIQIVKGEEYQERVNQQIVKKTNMPAARGVIYDKNGKVLAGNKAEYALTYTKKHGTDPKDMIRLAQHLSKYIDKSTEDVTKRDKQDYWILTTKQPYQEKLTTNERKITDQDKKFKLLLSRITDQDLSSITNEQLEVIAIYRELYQARYLTPHFVKVGLTDAELAKITEHLYAFDNMIDTTIIPKRLYPNGSFFFLGDLKQIPKEKVNRYLGLGYDRNDLVGTSYLEKQYESVLRGKPTQLAISSESFHMVKKIKGKSGFDISLTVDSELQKQIGKILEEEIIKGRRQGDETLKSAYVVMVNPNTGAVKALVGRKYNENTGSFSDVSYGTIQKQFRMGSTVKGATVLAGYQEGVITPNTFINDKPIIFRGGLRFRSYTSRIPYVNDISALKHSSNIYMAHIAMKLADFSYENKPGYWKVYPHNHIKGAFQTLRNVYSEFGLGVKTEIDLDTPSEATGYKGDISNAYPGQLIYYTIGQYDTYTPIQMAQYVSTIANGGYRMQLHLLNSIHMPEDSEKPGLIVKKFKPNVLNKVNNSIEEIERVKRGFHQVVYGRNGTATSLSSLPVQVAAKTGTAQVDLQKGTYNKTLVGFAPYKDPEVAFSIVVPNVKESRANLTIAEEVVEFYFKDHS